MNSSRNPPGFPYRGIWDEFDPDEIIDWEALELNSQRLQLHFYRLKDGPLSLSGVSRERFQALAAEVLHGEPSGVLVERLFLLARFLVAGEIQKGKTAYLKGQRSALKQLEKTARNFCEAAERISPEVEAWIPWLHGIKPERLLSEQEQLNLDHLRRGAHDLAIVAASAYRNMKPKPGRRPETRRDAAIRLGAEAVQEETGAPITWSRRTDAMPEPHFTNAGGRLLREFFKLIDPQIDERVIVQSLERIRDQA